MQVKIVCMKCRKLIKLEEWLDNPTLMASKDNTSHGVCSKCFLKYKIKRFSKKILSRIKGLYHV